MQTTTTSGSFQLIPQELRNTARWLTWHAVTRSRKDGTPRVDKVPDPTHWDRPEAWRSFDAVKGTGQLGYVFFEGDRVDATTGRKLALDLDSCRDPGTGAIHGWAKELIARCGNSFTEITVSGTGLRLWLHLVGSVAEGEWGKTHFTPLAMEPPTNGKKVECQVFGAGSTCFVTVSGNHLAGTSTEIARIDDLSWWKDLFGFDWKDTRGLKTKLKALPCGQGPEPTMATIKERILTEHGDRARQLLEADISSVVLAEDDDGTRADASYSEGFWELEQMVLRACYGHCQLAPDFMLLETAFGLGGEGLDPKYTSRSWVEGDLLRCINRTGAGVVPFTPLGASGAGAAPAPRRRMRRWDEVAQDPPVRWLVDDLLPRGGLVVLAGEPGAGKTLLVLDMGLKLAHGASWMGKKSKKASSLYLAGEGMGGLGARFRAWKAANADLVGSVGTEKAGGAGAGYVAVADGIPVLTGANAVNELLAEMERARDDYGALPDVVIIDTLAMSSPGMDENTAEDMGFVLRVLAEVGGRTGATMVVLHHLKKPQGQGAGEAGGKGGGGSMHSLRGSGALAGAADVVLLAEAADGGKVLRVVKGRDGEASARVAYTVRGQLTGALTEDNGPEKAPIIVRIDSATQEDADDVAKAKKAANEAEQEQRLVDALAGMGGEANTVDELVRAAGMKLTNGRDAYYRLRRRGTLLEQPTENNPGGRGSAKLKKIINSCTCVCDSLASVRGTLRASSPTPPFHATSGTSLDGERLQGTLPAPGDSKGGVDWS